jgi:hypothetical protein
VANRETNAKTEKLISAFTWKKMQSGKSELSSSEIRTIEVAAAVVFLKWLEKMPTWNLLRRGIYEGSKCDDCFRIGGQQCTHRDHCLAPPEAAEREKRFRESRAILNSKRHGAEPKLKEAPKSISASIDTDAASREYPSMEKKLSKRTINYVLEAEEAKEKPQRIFAKEIPDSGKDSEDMIV